MEHKADLRAAIDSVDRELLDALARRLTLARKVSRAKQIHGEDAHDPAREQEILRGLKARAKAQRLELPDGYIENIWEFIFEASRGKV